MESNRIAHFDLSVMLRTAFALEIYGGARPAPPDDRDRGRLHFATEHQRRRFRPPSEGRNQTSIR
jgi:hypothetical protein